MPISSGALDWPVSYYSKPTAVENVVTGYDNLDPWSRHHAYRNWTWKKMRNNRKKKKDKDSPEEKRLHRRRCCCCVLWWLTALLLIILTLVLFMVFWTRYRGSNLPDINFDEYENIPSCHGTWRKTFILCNSSTRPNVTYQCCYGVDALKAVSGHGDAWPGGWTFDGPCKGCKLKAFSKQRYRLHNSSRDRPRTDRPRVTTPAQDRIIRVLHLRNRPLWNLGSSARALTADGSLHNRRYWLPDRTVAPSGNLATSEDTSGVEGVPTVVEPLVAITGVAVMSSDDSTTAGAPTTPTALTEGACSIRGKASTPWDIPEDT
ncbi:uncharacterized protein LOC124253981 [Haliotis rubra]|uniref:uncharacterized protein LOC124253981 n=1 Tax=Haliotis rubra TaxID=36100 RepID=UPI001EE52B82|nr:uncharacterized protein LOC124253981 [Haliotis rubra]